MNPNRLSRGEVVVGSLDVNEGINDTDWVQFNTTPGGVNATGRLRWNDTDGTLDLVMKGGLVTQQIGLEQFMAVKHADSNGLTLGNAVYFVGSDGTNKTVRLARANAEGTSAETLGLIAETVSGGAKAFCCTFGLLSGLNTSTLTEGAIVWLSPTTPGALTTTKPSAPDHLVQVGFCVRSHANQGAIFVSVQNGYELDELHNVKITNPQNGDILVYQSSTGHWVNQQPA